MRLRLNSFQDLRNLLKGVEKYYTGNDLMDDQSLSELKHDSISFFSESEDEVVEASEKNSNVWCQQTMPNDNGNEILEFSHLSGIHTPNKSRRSVVSDVRYASSSPDSSHVTVSASSPVSTAGSTSSVMHAMSPNFCYI
jgi:phosphatidate phosphatase PAH1